MPHDTEPSWFLLIHQIPAKPGYLRVKISRRLGKVGAVALKNAVYALPRTRDAEEHFQWVLREIRKGGGNAALCEARFVSGLSNEDVLKLFTDARDGDYRKITSAARAALAKVGKKGVKGGESRAAGVETLRRRLSEVMAIDFFKCPGRRHAEAAVSELETCLASGGAGNPPPVTVQLQNCRNRIWVTRRDVGIDRMASAWLIRSFIDPVARFRFVPERNYHPEKGEVRFDMFEGEFGHEGDRCTFETLVERMDLRDSALLAISEIVHDIDLRDRKFRREETPGIAHLFSGISMNVKKDEERVKRGSAVFGDLYEYFRKTRR